MSLLFAAAAGIAMDGVLRSVAKRGLKREEAFLLSLLCTPSHELWGGEELVGAGRSGRTLGTGPPVCGRAAAFLPFDVLRGM